MDGVHSQVCICRRDLLGKLLENQFRNILPLDLDSFSKLQNCEVGNGDLLSPDEEGFLTDVAIQLQRLLSSISTQSHPLLPNIRAAAQIPRTGRDILISRLNASNWRFTLSLI